MLKRSIFFSFLFVFALTLTFFSLPDHSTFAKVKAPSNVGDLSPDTVITKDNIYQVLDYYGINPDNLTFTQNSDNLQTMTVGEFGEIVKQSQADSKVVTTNLSDNSSTSTDKTTSRNSSISPNLTVSPYVTLPGGGGGGCSTGTTTLSKTVDSSSGYSIKFNQTGHYGTQCTWTSAGGSSATMVQPSFGITSYSIISDSFNAYVTNSGNTLEQDSVVKIGKYASMGVGSVQASVLVTTMTNYATLTWGTSYIP